MRVSPTRTLAFVAIVFAFGTLSFAMARGGDILMIVVGLVLAAAGMELFRQANLEKEE